MQVFAKSDIGRERKTNEDFYYVSKPEDKIRLFILADGMGGYNAGEVASRMAVTTIGSRFQSMSSLGTKIDAITWLKEIIEEVNTNIIRYAEEHVDANGLGTTLVCAVLSKDYLIFANVGDSSGFVFKSGKLYKVTKDHTLVNVLVESGELRPEEAENHPLKNVLMKALGAAENVDADIFDVETSVDWIFLCSDGLTNMVTKEQIERVLNDNTLDIEEKVDKLILKSNLRGGNDNISIAYLSREGVV